MDNLYTDLTLASALHDYQTFIVGTVRASRAFFPSAFWDSEKVNDF